METFIDTQEWVPVHRLPGFEAAIEYYVNKEGQVKSTKYNQDRILYSYSSKRRTASSYAQPLHFEN